jgi:hypothetical protein
MWMRFAVHAEVGEILDADQAFYRLHNQNMHNSLRSDPYKYFQQRRAAYDIVFQDFGDMIPAREQLRKMADRSLASDALWAVCQAFYRRKVAQTPILDLIKFATNSKGGKFFNLEDLRVYFNLSSKIFRAVRGKLGAGFG